MNRHPTAIGQGKRGFTLIELLIVVSIIAILAAMLMPALIKVVINAKVRKARIEIGQLVTAINQYETAYNRYPTSIAAGTNDFTYGGSSLDAVFGTTGIWSTNNSEVIAILMDIQTYPSGASNTVNFGHVKNTQRTRFLNAKMVGDSVSPGVGQDLVYRDPWGNPYIISMDLNYDGNCADAFYKLRNVSQSSGADGFNGLFNVSDRTGASDDYEYHGGVMVWSLGPNKQAAVNNPPGGNATQGVNNDNVLSWGQ